MTQKAGKESRVSFKHTHINDQKQIVYREKSHRQEKTFIIKVKSLDEDENALVCEIAFNL